MAPQKVTTLPVIPLTKNTVLLPGIIQRIPVTLDRPDIPALLSQVYSRATSRTPSQRIDNVHIACVPLGSHLLSQTGQRMIPQTEESPKLREKLEINPASAAKHDLFGFGTAAKISGVEGRGTGEFALLVEGMARVRIEKITQERPFFEAEVVYHYDGGEERVSLRRKLSLTLPSYIASRYSIASALCSAKAVIS
jgi:ATP-dependent Lon protease